MLGVVERVEPSLYAHKSDTSRVGLQSYSRYGCYIRIRIIGRTSVVFNFSAAYETAFGVGGGSFSTGNEPAEGGKEMKMRVRMGQGAIERYTDVSSGVTRGGLGLACAHRTRTIPSERAPEHLRRKPSSRSATTLGHVLLDTRTFVH